MTEGLLCAEPQRDLLDEGNTILGDFGTPGPWIVSFAVPKSRSTLAFRRSRSLGCINYLNGL